MTEQDAPPRLACIWCDPLGPSGGARSGTVLFLVLVAFTAFYDLGARSLYTLDLPRFGVLAREMIRSGEWLVPTRFGEVYANKPPLMIWLIAAPSAVFGEVTAFLVRLPSALGLALLVLSTAAWGRMRTGSLVAGRTAALLLLGTYAITRFGREGRPDMLAAGLTVAATYLLDRASLRRGRQGDPWLAGLLLGLALLAKGPAYLLLPVLVLLIPMEGHTRRARIRAARPLVVLGTAVAVAAVWFVPAVLSAGWGYGQTLLFEQAATRVAGTANHAEPATYYFIRIFTDGGAPWSPLYLAAFLCVFGAPRLLGGARPLVLAALVTIVLFSLVPTKHLRYVLFVYPLLAMGAAWLAHRFLERPARRWWPRLLDALGLAALLAAAVCAILGVPVERAVIRIILPALGLAMLATGVLMARARGVTPEEARRSFVGASLVAVVLLLSMYWVVRDRYRVRAREVFDQAVAEAVVPSVEVWTLAPIDPGQVFHAVPHAHAARTLADLPTATEARRILVLAPQKRRGEVETHRGEKASVLLEQAAEDHGPPVQLLAFGAPD